MPISIEDCSTYKIVFDKNSKVTFLYDYQEEINYLEKALKVKIELKAKQLYDLFMDYFSANCSSIYSAAHFKEEIALLDRNYLSEPTFDYKLRFEVEGTQDTPRMLGTVDSIRRACDFPYYEIQVMNETCFKGNLFCMFKSRIELQKIESGEFIKGMFATEVFIIFNSVLI
jgi:hypothetical protein